MFEKASRKKVLFVGERITDVYHYGRLIGRPPKEPIICIEHKDTQTFQGGVTAAADHARAIVAVVDVCSSVEIRKERFLEQSHYRKLFEMYGGKTTIDSSWPLLTHYDAVVVTDYGHGMMTPDVVVNLVNSSRYLAVNVQTNSGNYGFNLATKYPRVDYLCVDEVEARLATQNPEGPIEKSVVDLGSIADKVVVTLGRGGAIGRDRSDTFTMPAYTERVVDTMGAGDAFFAVTACMAEELTIPELLRVGNAAGALKAQSVGQKAINKDDLRRFLDS